MTQDAQGVTGPTVDVLTLYDVLTVQPRLVPDANGFPVEGLRVTFSVAGAGEQFVELPLKGLTEDVALTAIQDRTLLVLGILELSGPQVQLGPDGKPTLVSITPVSG